MTIITGYLLRNRDTGRIKRARGRHGTDRYIVYPDRCSAEATVEAEAALGQDYSIHYVTMSVDLEDE